MVGLRNLWLAKKNLRKELIKTKTFKTKKRIKLLNKQLENFDIKQKNILEKTDKIISEIYKINKPVPHSYKIKKVEVEKVEIKIKEGLHNSYFEEVNVELICNTPRTNIFYTLDGAMPNANSKRYIKPIKLKKSTVLKTIAMLKGKESLINEQFFRITLPVQSIEWKNFASKKYKAKGKLSLIDNMVGTKEFTDGNWLGWEAGDADITLDLGKNQKISNILLGCLKSQNSWIFLPKEITIAYSEDGKVFSRETTKKIDNEKYSDNNRHSIEIPTSVTARFIKILVENIDKCPDWHAGAGGKAWLFMDEITIE